MSIEFNCTQCGKIFRVKAEHAGKRAKCTGCGAVLTVPEPSPAASLPPAPWPEMTAPTSFNAPSPSPHHHVAVIEEGLDDDLNFRQKAPADDGLDMTPMVDVTFLLLIFFMITAAFSAQKAIELPSPEQSDQAAVTRTIEEIENDSETVVVRIDRDDTIWVEDARAPSKHELISKLKAARQGGGDGRGPNKMVVMASDEAQIKTVVMALDAGTAVGMEEVRLAGAEDD